MKSKAQVGGHPLHPILIAFPTAFLTGGFAFDLFAWLARWDNGRAPGAYLSIAGVASGLVAGIPGFIDYLFAIPPNSSARDRAWYHMMVNLAALATYAAGAYFRNWSTYDPGFGTLALEFAGVGLLTGGGWLGGTLVYKEQIAVDHFHANAKPTLEATVAPNPQGATVVARTDEIALDQMKLVRLGDRRIVVARTGDGFRAFDDRCSHKGAPLSDGVLMCGTVHCPWHGSRFDCATGAVTAGPAKNSITTYPVEVVGTEIRVTLPAEVR